MRKLVLLFGLIALFQNVNAQTQISNKDSIVILNKEHTTSDIDKIELSNRIDKLENIVTTETEKFKWRVIISSIIINFIALFSIYWAVRSVTLRTLSKPTGIQKSIIKQNLKEFDKHTKLRKDSKIIVLSRDEIFNDNFKKVMKLFEVDLNYPDFYLVVNDIETYGFEELVNKLNKFDVVVIENMINSTWEMETLVTKKHFIDLAQAICNKTSIIYFGHQDNQFPSKYINLQFRDLLTFANVPSQLYSNLLNMLKYRDEMKIKV